MKKTPLFLLLGLCGCGLLSGYSLRYFTRDPAAVAALPGLGPRKARPVDNREIPEVSASSKLSAPAVPRPRSSDTVESLLSADPVTGYARIASWLATASEQEISAFWAAYKEGERDSDITELIFINWTRLNPRAAIAGAAAGGNGFSAWEAWAATDPKAALAAALAVGEEQAGYVASGIGKFAPEWLREHFEGGIL